MGQTTGRWLGVLCLWGALIAGAFAQDLSWPQEVSGPDGTLVIYQPQPESLKGNRLSARAAISIELPGGAEPVFAPGARARFTRGCRRRTYKAPMPLGP